MTSLNSTASAPRRAGIRVGIVGDFKPDSVYHRATNEALAHAAHSMSATVNCTWVPTPSLDQDAEATLGQFDALWCAPGSPYESMEGALQGIRFAREKDRPFFGT